MTANDSRRPRNSARPEEVTRRQRRTEVSERLSAHLSLPNAAFHSLSPADSAALEADAETRSANTGGGVYSAVVLSVVRTVVP